MSNLFRITQRSLQHPGFARSIALRRCFEHAHARWPRLPGMLSFPKPLEVVIAVTSRCQLRCGMCGIRKIMARPRFRNSRLTLQDLLPLFDEIMRWPLKPYVKLTGGEPLLLRGELVDMVDACRTRGLPTRVSTNGCLLARKGLAADLVGSGLDVVTISLDGPREVHNRARGSRSAFERALEGIRNLDEAKKRIGSRSPMIQMTTVLHAANHRHLRELFGVIRALPVQWWHLQLLNFISADVSAEADRIAVGWGHEPGPWCEFIQDPLCSIDAETLARDIRWVQAQRTSFAKSFLGIGALNADRLKRYYAGSREVLKRRMCVIPFISLHVVPTGDMVFCIDYPNVTYGNIRTDPAGEAWVSERARTFRENLIGHYRTAGSNLPQCNRCNWLYN